MCEIVYNEMKDRLIFKYIYIYMYVDGYRDIDIIKIRLDLF